MALGTGLSFQHWDTTANKTKRIAVDDSVTTNVARLYQVQARELHVGGAGALNIMDTSGDSVGVFNSSGAHSLGKSGQNVRLASKLTGYDLDISGEEAKPAPAPKATEPKPMPKLKRKEQLESSLLEAIEEHGE